MLTSVANSSSLSSMLATVTSPWLTKGKSKGLVEIRSKSVKDEGVLTPQTALSLGAVPAADGEAMRRISRAYQLVLASCLT